MPRTGQPEAALVDELTGLRNRRYLNRTLPQELKRSESSGKPLSLFLVDIDYFKDINDTYGHRTGDEALVKVAELVRSNVESSDIVCRFAGDEFVVILVGVDNQTAMKAAKRVADRVSGVALEVLGRPLEISISVGVATFPEDGGDAAGLFDFADKALYSRKRRGRNGVCGRAEVLEDMVAEVGGFAPTYCPKLVGREAELSKMVSLLDGKGRLVLVSGEIGIGKSSLVKKFVQLGGSRGRRVLFGRCPDEVAPPPYVAFTGAIADYGVSHEKETRKALEAMDSVYRRQLLELVPSLCALGLERGTLSKLPADQAELRLVESIKQLIAGLASDAPVLLVLEDLHWSDASTIGLLHYVARNTRDCPVLICGTYREGEVRESLLKTMRDMRMERLYESVHLDRLPRQDVVRMVGLMLDLREVPEDFGDAIYRETEGNPLFTEEVLRSLVHEGFVKDKSDLDTSVLERFRVPRALKGVIERRLSLLGSDLRAVLSYASAMGYVFDFDLLVDVTKTNEGHLLELMSKAVRAQLIREEFLPGVDRYSFGHSKVKDVLYEAMTDRRRRMVHLTIGETMEEFHKDCTEPYLEDLARQFFAGENWEKAFMYSVEVGRKAKDVFANHDALVSYRRALDAFGRLDSESRHRLVPTTIALYRDMGDVFHLLGEYDEASSSYTEMADISRLSGDKDAESKAAKSAGNVSLSRGCYDEALKYYEKSLVISREIGDNIVAARSLNNIGLVHWNKGSCDEALKYYDESLAMARAIDDKRGAARTLDNIGLVHWGKGSYDEALSFYEEALSIKRKMADKKGIAWTLHDIGIIMWRKGSYDDALKYHRESMSIKKEVGDRRGIAWSLFNIGLIHRDRGLCDEALKYFEKALKIFIEMGEKSGTAWSLHNIGIGLRRKGSYGETLKRYQDALVLFEEIGEKSGIAWSYNSIGILHWKRGLYDEALRFFHDGLEMFRELGDRSGVARCLYNSGAVLEGKGESGEALNNYEAALGILRDIGDKSGVAISLYNIAGLQCARAAYDAALGCCEESLTISREENDRKGIASSLLVKGELRRKLGYPGDAAVLHEQALSCAREIGDKEVEGRTLVQLGVDMLCSGRVGDSLSRLNEASGLAADIRDLDLEMQALQGLGAAHLASGEPEKADTITSRLLTIAEEKGLVKYLVEGRLLKARLLPAGSAHPQAQEALKLADQLDMPESGWRAHLLLSSIYSEEGNRIGGAHHLQEARAIVESIASKISGPSVKKAYLSKPEHRELFDSQT